MENRADHNAHNNNERKSLLCSFVKTGKDIVKSVVFWCVAVSIAASACHIAGDAVTSFGERKTESIPAESRVSGGSGTVPEGQISGDSETVPKGRTSGDSETVLMAQVTGDSGTVPEGQMSGKMEVAEKGGLVLSESQIPEEAGLPAANQDAGNGGPGEDTSDGGSSVGNAGTGDSPDDGVSDGASSKGATGDSSYGGTSAGAAGTSDSQGDLPTASLKKTVALTFDDGPHPVYTKKLLDGLLERDVKATFFVVGENIPGNEDLIARMEEEGHLIGNHTYNHVKICDMKKEDACYQVEQTSALVREITGHDTEFVRPPFGAWNPDLECSFVMIPVLWDVDPLDWTTSNTPLVVQRVIEDVEDQDIVLLHDFYESSVDAALQIVDILKKEGFEFVTADKLILP